MRTDYDIEMMRELGFCSGIENYSRHLSGRAPGQRPFCHQEASARRKLRRESPIAAAEVDAQPARHARRAHDLLRERPRVRGLSRKAG
jgi:hypothetical protein